MSCFDKIQYDEQSALINSALKAKLENILDFMDRRLIDSRAKSIVKSKLEEAFMWAGKAIRDDQIVRYKKNGQGQISGNQSFEPDNQG